MSPADLLFATIDELCATRPFRLGSVGAVLGFDVVETGRNEHFRTGRASRGHGPIQVVEVRERLCPEPGRDGLVLLGLSLGSPVSLSTVMERYGGRPELSVPMPEEPPESPVHYRFERPWGTVAFGYTRSVPSRLVSVVLDAVGQRPARDISSP